MKIFTDKRIKHLEEAFFENKKVLFNGENYIVKQLKSINTIELLMMLKLDPSTVYFYELEEATEAYYDSNK